MCHVLKRHLIGRTCTVVPDERTPSIVVDGRRQQWRRFHDVNDDDDNNETRDAAQHRLTSQRQQVTAGQRLTSSRQIPNL